MLPNPFSSFGFPKLKVYVKKVEGSMFGVVLQRLPSRRFWQALLIYTITPSFL